MIVPRWRFAIFLLLHWRFSVTAWNPEYLENLLVPLTKLVYTQDILWFISEKLNAEDYEKMTKFVYIFHEKVDLAQTIYTNRRDVRIRLTDTMRNTLSLVITTGADDPIMDVYDKTTTGRHLMLGFVILVDVVHDFSVVERVLIRLKEKHFFATICYFEDSHGVDNLFGFVEFPQFTIKNRTDFMPYFQHMLSTAQSTGNDVGGYRFPSPLRLDLPGIFEYDRAKEGKRFQGISSRILKLFMDYINGSIEEVVMPMDALGGQVVDIKASLDLVRERKVPLLAHSYALFETDETIDKSYPIMVVRWCLMVPLRNSVSTLYYTIQPFDGIVWFAWMGTFIALLLVDGLRIWCRWSRNRPYSVRRDLEDSWLNNFCHVVYLGAATPLRVPSAMRFIFYSCVFFYGFFLTANYTSVLGSILAVTLFREQINTMDDLIQANISVMITHYELEFLLSRNYELPDEFLGLLRPVDPATMHSHQVPLNNSFAYFVTEDKWHFLNLQQKYLKQRIFKFTDICFGSHHLAFPMEPDSPVWRNMEYFLYRVHSSGMLQHYESISFDDAAHAGLVQRFSEANEYTSAGLDHLAIIFALIVSLNVISVFVFLGEWLMFALKKQRTARKSMRGGRNQ